MRVKPTKKQAKEYMEKAATKENIRRLHTHVVDRESLSDIGADLGSLEHLNKVFNVEIKGYDQSARFGLRLRLVDDRSVIIIPTYSKTAFANDKADMVLIGDHKMIDDITLFLNKHPSNSFVKFLRVVDEYITGVGVIIDFDALVAWVERDKLPQHKPRPI